MIKVADFIARKLVEHGISDVFMITGGGAMHLNDAFGKCEGLNTIFNHHEQASAMAAEGYTRVSGKIAAVCVTTGPGGTNAITGVLGAWLDSIPMLIISGQVRFDTTVRSTDLKLRQLGDQEFDITVSVANMTKYAVMVTDPIDIEYHLERAIYLASIGRPGPCWIDIPLNIQGALIDENNLRKYHPNEDTAETPPVIKPGLLGMVRDKIQAAKRPVLYVGSAVRSSGAYQDLLILVERLKIPVVTAFNAHDYLPEKHPLYFGRPGTIGDRSGNFVVQNSDLVLVLGCRLNIRQISYNWRSFAREAFKIMVDIDQEELQKPTITPDLPIHADVADFIRSLIEIIPSDGLLAKTDWIEWCRVRKERYPVVLSEYWEREDMVNPYCFIESLSAHLPESISIVSGNGSACVCAFQALKIKAGQRLFSNSGCASMGYDVPAAIGACFASNRQKVICLAGDGSIQMNLQELQTIVHYNLPIKIFVLNNDGYHSIRQTQTNFFVPPLVGCDPKSGISFPDMERIAYAYQIPFLRCHNHSELDDCITKALQNDNPFICEMMLTTEQPFAPKMSSKRMPDGKMVSKPLEDMYPFLEREDFKSNMIIDSCEE